LQLENRRMLEELRGRRDDEEPWPLTLTKLVKQQSCNYEF
jgi:hypothetical protein